MLSKKIRDISIFSFSLLLLFLIIFSILLTINNKLSSKNIHNNKSLALERLTQQDQKAVEGDCIIALDEAMVRYPEGRDVPIKISPKATFGTLEQRIGEMANGKKIMPICYPKGKKTKYSGTIITNNIVVGLSNPDVIPELPEGIKVKSRPGSYSPNVIILEAPDSFAAIRALPILRTTGGIGNAYISLAREMALD